MRYDSYRYWKLRCNVPPKYIIAITLLIGRRISRAASRGKPTVSAPTAFSLPSISDAFAALLLFQWRALFLHRRVIGFRHISAFPRRFSSRQTFSC